MVGLCACLGGGGGGGVVVSTRLSLSEVLFLPPAVAHILIYFIVKNLGAPVPG